MKRTAPRLNAPMVEWALWWASRGWPVFPVWQPLNGLDCACGQTHKDSGKHPIIKDGFKGGSADPETIKGWWQQWPNANIGSTLPAGMLGIDIDGELDEGLVFPETETHKTGKGVHLIYANNLGTPLDQTQGTGRYWTNVDTRVSGKGYLVLPPSLHPSGVRYELTNDMMPIEFPDSMVPDVKGKKTTTKKVASSDPEVVKLLTMPRDAPELGDDAMAKVAGYLARYVPDKDHFDALLWAINAGLAEPLHPTALAKKRGIFDKHHEELAAKQSQAVDDAARGWLYEMGEVGYSTQVGTGDNLDFVAWSNFRVRAKSLMDYGDHQVWVVDFHKADGTVLEDVELPSDVLASTPALRRFLVNRGMALLAPSNDKRGNHGERLMCLLQSQDFQRHTVVDAYGWSTELSAFVTPEKLIRADSVETTHNITGQSANVKLNYGFEPAAEAVAALKEYMTFQDDTCMSLLGAWLMVLYLKGQYTEMAPNLAVEAFSGSGKTTYIELLSQFAGYKKKPGRLTYAVARNEFMVSRNIFCWHDDVTMDERLQELFRAAATGGAYELTDMSKRDGSTKVIELRASMVVSSESITFFDQKAMHDRFVKVSFPDPTGRRSRHDPKVDQWHDVVAFKRKHDGDLTKFAGTLVQLALQHAEELQSLADLMPETTRYGQQIGLMRVGARVLAAITEDPTHIERVDQWAKSLEYRGSASLVITKAAPVTWMNHGQPETRGNMMPVFYNDQEGLFYICPEKLAEYWHQSRKGLDSRDIELTTADGIRTELKACGVDMRPKKDGKRWPCVRLNGTKEWGTWYRVPRKYSDMIYRIATGSVPEDEAGD